MIIATWNVNSLTVRLEHLVAWMKNTVPDVVCLQETKIVDAKFPVQAFTEIGYESVFFGEKTYNGVAIISNRPIGCVQKGFAHESEDASKRFIEAEIDGIKILNTYIPNGQSLDSDKFVYKLSWLAALKEHISKSHSPASPIIWVGDFNVAPEDIDIYDPQAMAGQIMCSSREREALEDLQKWGFVDAFRLNENRGGYYSWWDYRMAAFRRNMGFRIDHIWITNCLVKGCRRVWIDKEPRKLERPSDHTPVVAEIAWVR